MTTLNSLSADECGATTTARSSTAALTASRLGEAWPEVSTRLHRLLASRGVDETLRDDIVQEVAVRALTKQVPFTDPADLYAWAATAARNLHVDHLRSGGRTTGDEVLEAVPDVVDVAHAAERRVALGHVFRALATMRPGEREAILDGLGEERYARTSQALVRRHRARATLRKAVGGAISAAGLWRLRLRAVSTPSLRTAGAVAMLAPAIAISGGGIHAVRVTPAPAPPVQTAPFTRAAAPERVRPAAATVRKPAPPAARPVVPRRPAPLTRSVTVGKPPSAPDHRLEIETEDGTKVKQYERPRSESQGEIFCVDRAVVLSGTCVYYPNPKPHV